MSGETLDSEQLAKPGAFARARQDLGSLPRRMHAAAGLDVLAVLAGAALVTVLTTVPPSVPVIGALRFVLAAMFATVVPGYLIVAIALPRASEMDWQERVGLGIGASMVILAVLAPVLDRTVGGLGPNVLVIADLAIVLVGSAVLVLRRVALSEQAPTPLAAPALAASAAWLSGTGGLGRWTLAGLLTIVGLVVVVVSAPLPDRAAAAFYMLGPDGFAGGYPYTVGVGSELRLRVGVENNESESHTYRIEARLEGAAAAVKPLARTNSFTLQPGAEQEQTIAWTVASENPAEEVDLVLLRDQEVTPFRQLKLTLDVASAK
jgi:uncharacterized membrane protein